MVNHEIFSHRTIEIPIAQVGCYTNERRAEITKAATVVFQYFQTKFQWVTFICPYRKSKQIGCPSSILEEFQI